MVYIIWWIIVVSFSLSFCIIIRMIRPRIDMMIWWLYVCNQHVLYQFWQNQSNRSLNWVQSWWFPAQPQAHKWRVTCGPWVASAWPNQTYHERIEWHWHIGSRKANNHHCLTPKKGGADGQPSSNIGWDSWDYVVKCVGERCRSRVCETEEKFRANPKANCFGISVAGWRTTIMKKKWYCILLTYEFMQKPRMAEESCPYCSSWIFPFGEALEYSTLIQMTSNSFLCQYAGWLGGQHDLLFHMLSQVGLN